MSGEKQYGVVVVGLGMAGKVRVRDLKEETCGFRLRGVVSRRPVEIDDVRALTFDDALNEPDVDVLLLCTEPALHEEYARRGLERGKHVLVEYPLALSSKAARSLYQLADDKGLILHEENLAYLTDSFSVLKPKASQAELKSAQYSLKGAFNGWIENFEKSGLPFITGISCIQCMLDLFGDLDVVSGKLEKTVDGYVANAELKTKNGKPISLTLSRYKRVKRETKALYEFEDGEIIDPDNIPYSKPGLFMIDLENFYAAIKKGKIPEEQRRISILSLEIAEKIHSFF